MSNQFLNAAAMYRNYRTACFGNAVLSPDRERETRQAFISGMYAGFMAVNALAEVDDKDKAAKLLETLIMDARKECSEHALACYAKGN